MSLKQPHILIIDDDSSVNRALSLVLHNDFHVVTTTSAKEGLEIARRDHPFLALVDLKMPEADGIEVLKELKGVEPEMAVMIMTAYGEISAVVEAFKHGAVDFLTKPFDNWSLLENIKRLATLISFERESLQPQIKEIVGESPAMKGVWELVRRFAPSDIPVLLQGETGTGKELFAKVIHSMSKRNMEPFVPVDCSALPESLIESELFGYEKGAFTGAISRKEGLFESANNGTLFLDEIGNLPLPIQAKLLRVVQDHNIFHLGSRGYDPIPLNIRIIAATNIDLEETSQKGSFRKDLYYRISVAIIKLPPLKERHGDVPRLINYFLARCNREFKKSVTISDDALSLLDDYHWPGNIRELENVIKSAFLIADNCIRPCHLSEKIIEKERRGTRCDEDIAFFASLNASTAIERSENNATGRGHPPGPGIIAEFKEPYHNDSMDIKAIRNIAAEEVERQTILQIMKDHPFINKTELAKLLKIDPKTLRSRLKKYGLNPD